MRRMPGHSDEAQTPGPSLGAEVERKARALRAEGLEGAFPNWDGLGDEAWHEGCHRHIRSPQPKCQGALQGRRGRGSHRPCPRGRTHDRCSQSGDDGHAHFAECGGGQRAPPGTERRVFGPRGSQG